MTRRLALIYAELGDYENAIKAAQLSIENATKADNKNYIEMNTKSIKEWTNLKK